MRPMEVANKFGDAVNSIVCELTFIPTTDEREQRAAEKAQYMESFSKKSIEALVCKLADRLCNTLDKVRSENNHKSAKNYFHKADALFKAWWDRMDELVARFGQQVQDNIEEQYDSVLVALE